VFVYLIGIFLQKKELEYHKNCVDICDKYLYSDLRSDFRKKIEENKQIYLNDCFRRAALWFDGFCYSALNLVFVASLILFFI